MIDVSSHKNVENVIRFFLSYLPPRGAESILDIGGGSTAPYKGVLQTRCKKYRNLDIRPGDRVDYCQDVVEGTDFKDKEWDWVWCSETLEHVPQEYMKTVNDQDIRNWLSKELKHYEVYGKAKRAEEVKKAIKAAGGKVETKTAKPKAELDLKIGIRGLFLAISSISFLELIFLVTENACNQLPLKYSS